jgi:hypothetical protein
MSNPEMAMRDTALTRWSVKGEFWSVFMTTAQKVYAELVRDLSTSERLQLAQLILRDLEPGHADYNDEWSEEDLNDLSAVALRYAQAESADEEEPSC